MVGHQVLVLRIGVRVPPVTNYLFSSNSFLSFFLAVFLKFEKFKILKKLELL